MFKKRPIAPLVSSGLGEDEGAADQRGDTPVGDVPAQTQDHALARCAHAVGGIEVAVLAAAVGAGAGAARLGFAAINRA